MPSKKTTSQNSSVDPATKYAQDVVSGKIVAGPHVRDSCRRHLDDLKHGHKRGLRWDVEEVDRILRFFRKVLTVEIEREDEEGDTVSEAIPFDPAPSQAFILGSLFGWKNKQGLRRFRRAYIEEGKGNGKALALDTPIPTPSGWTMMGELRDGDAVFDDAGKPCKVVMAHPASDDRECYRVEFDDGEVVVASAEHLWQTEMRSATKHGESRATKGVPKAEWGSWRNGLRTTAEIAETLRYANGKYQSTNHSVALCGTLDLPDVDLPIEPYALGVWLGDGDSDCARITIGDQDVEATTASLRAAGWKISEKQGSKRYRITGLQTKLRAAGLLNNKHIPAAYMRASVAQRYALLQGLMDTDGYISTSGQCEFTQTRRGLSEQVLELSLSLGLKATLRTGKAKIDGREIGPKYRVTFHPREDQPCFRILRKLERQRARHGRRRLSGDRRIVACGRIAPVPVRCITVDSPSGMFLAGRAMIPTHNSPLAAGIGHYMMTATHKLRAEVYSAATDKDQAAILFRDAVEMWRRSPALYQRLVPSGQNPVWQLSLLDTASFFKPISSEKKGKSGIRPYCALVDEIHEHTDNSVIEMLRAGTKGNRQALIFEITNSGFDRQSVCWNEHEYATKIASGAIENDAFFSYVCALDEGDDPFEDESCWLKANPLLGVSIQPEFVREQVQEARGMPSKEAMVRRLHFCEWTEAQGGWISRPVWMACEQDLKWEDYQGDKCYGGLDLSYTRDLSAFATVFPTGPDTFDAFVDFWKPKEGLNQAIKEDRVPYDLWVKNDHLQLTEGRVIKLGPIAQRMAEISDRCDLQSIAHDRYRHRELEDDLLDLGIELPMTEHPQGFRRAGENPLWMPNSFQELENAIVEGRIRIAASPVLRWNAASAVVRNDPAGTDNRIFDKRKSHARIDGVVALAMALGMAVTGTDSVFPVPMDHILEA